MQAREGPTGDRGTSSSSYQTCSTQTHVTLSTSWPTTQRHAAGCSQRQPNCWQNKILLQMVCCMMLSRMRNRRGASANQVGAAHSKLHSNVLHACKLYCTYGLCVFSSNDCKTCQVGCLVQGFWALCSEPHLYVSTYLGPRQPTLTMLMLRAP